MDYEQAIKRPFSDLKKFLIGIILSIIPIVNFLSVGYILESAKLTLNKKTNLPEWKNWKELFVHGLFTFIIFAIFILPATLVMITGIGAGFLKALVMWLIKGSLILSILEGIKTSIPLLIASMLLGFVAIYLLPIAIINYIKRWKFIDAFNFKDIFNKIFTSKYLISWIIATVISTIITGILHIIPFIGDKIGLFVSGIISITILAQAYNEIK